MGDRSSSVARTKANRSSAARRLFDTHAEVSLDFELVRQAASQKYTRPFLILDTAIVRSKVRRFRAAMPRVRPHYAVKANPDPRVLKVLVAGGRGLRDRLDRRARPAARARRAGGGGVLLQPDEVARGDRLRRGQGRGVVRRRQRRRAAPHPRGQARRQAVPAHRHPQHRQRLAALRQVRLRRRRRARDHRRRPRSSAPTSPGVTFHVGSQCRNPENWRVALERAKTLFDVMTKAGLKPRLLNIGGGYPVRHVKPIPSIEVIGQVVNEGLQGVRRGRAGDRRARPLPGVRRRLLRVPRARHRDARRQALDALGRGPVRRRDRVERGPALPRAHRPLRARTWPGPSAARPATRWTS